MIVTASGMWNYSFIWLMLEGASIGTFLHTGLKLPWGAWFARKEPVCEAREPPKNMLAAMGITAFLCTLLGVYPKILYDILPYPVHYEPYAAGHVVAMCQLLLFTFVAFWLLRGMLHGTPTITLDTDWFYRIAGKRVIWFCQKPLMDFANFIDRNVMRMAAFSLFILPKTQTVVENRIDKAFHVRLPELLNFEKIHDKIKRIKSRELSYNLIYILLAMLLLLVYVLFTVVMK